jgi:hypothetical protein
MVLEKRAGKEIGAKEVKGIGDKDGKRDVREKNVQWLKRRKRKVSMERKRLERRKERWLERRKVKGICEKERKRDWTERRDRYPCREGRKKDWRKGLKQGSKQRKGKNNLGEERESIREKDVKRDLREGREREWREGREKE